jgi:hypothetical protein
VPFTVSHVVAVLPLRARPGRRLGLPTAPLVIGSMVPDLPLFLHHGTWRPFTHSPAGLVLADLPAAVLCAVLWSCAVQPLVQAAVPGLAARSRAAVRPAGPRGCAAWALGALLGSASHLLWDWCTHGDGLVVERWGVLRTTLAGAPLFSWLQLGSSAAALAVLALWARWWWTTTPRVADGPETDRAAGPLLTGLVGAAVAVAVLRAAAQPQPGLSLGRRLVSVAARGSVDAGTAVLALLCLLGLALRLASSLGWWRPRPRTSVTPGGRPGAAP